MATLALEKLKKSYGDTAVVHGIDLDISDGEFVVLVGPSGCGKSTILRMIAGLEDITEGEIRIGDRRVNEIAAKDRNVAMVFQDYALYPHMTVAANIGFGLKMRGFPAGKRDERVREVAELLKLEPYLDRKPRTLSGGQRQRVAMGRALARSAQLFLFDEPLSNLDAKLRMEVRTQIRLLHQELGMTTVFVTHDQTEAMTLADRIVCLDAGRVSQVGTPEELYVAPQNTFVATFIGSPQINILEAEVTQEKGEKILRLSDGQELPIYGEHALDLGRKVLVGIRPEDLTDESRLSGIGKPQSLTLSYLVSETLGSDTFLIGDIAGTRVAGRCAPDTRPSQRAQFTVYADADRLHLFDPRTGQRL
jgi:multiple sugar transport system ATP-binding protein